MDRARPARARARRRHRGGRARARRGGRVAPVLAVPRPLQDGQPLPRTMLRQREGVGRERRRVHPPQPARAQGRLARRAQRPAAGGLRPPELPLARPWRAPHARGALRGPRRHALAAPRPLRRRALGQVPRRQAPSGDRRRPRLPLRPRLALLGAARRGAGGNRRGARRPRPQGRPAAAGVRRRPRRPQPALARPGADCAPEGVRGVRDRERHARGPGGLLPPGGGSPRQATDGDVPGDGPTAP